MFEFDPERALWKPGRRSFLFMFGAALVAPTIRPVREIHPKNLIFHPDYYSLVWPEECVVTDSWETNGFGETVKSDHWIGERFRYSV